MITFSQLILAVEEGGEEASETVNPILPTSNELFWGFICFFGLYALMKFVLLPPVLRVMDERERRIREDRQAAEAAETGAAEAQAAYAARIAEARAEANSLLQAAREEADAYRAEQYAQANAEVNARREEAQAEVAAAKEAAMAQLRGDVANVAVTAASRVIGKDLDVSAEMGVIESYVNETGSTTGQSR